MKNSVAPRLSQESNLEDLEIDLLLEGLKRRYGYDFCNYARPSLTRRIRAVMIKERIGSISVLQDRLLRDHAFMMRFVEHVSVHTTAMFRDPEVYKLIRTQVVPLLRTYPFVRIWHAGCSTGEEVYSLAILLTEEGIYDRCRIYATDISDVVLERARKSIFPLRAIAGYTGNYQRAGGKTDFSSYYVADRNHVAFRAALRKNMTFSQHNLVCDGPFNEFQLIVCRNVMIYFNSELQERVYTLFQNSMSKFGILALGKKESLQFTKHAADYAEMAPGLRVYRRVR